MINSVQWGSPNSAQLLNGRFRLHTQGLPGTGSILTLILNILNGYNLTDSILNYHRIVESFKFGYALRTKLADKKFVEGLDEVMKVFLLCDII